MPRALCERKLPAPTGCRIQYAQAAKKVPTVWEELPGSGRSGPCIASASAAPSTPRRRTCGSEWSRYWSGGVRARCPRLPSALCARRRRRGSIGACGAWYGLSAGSDPLPPPRLRPLPRPRFPPRPRPWFVRSWIGGLRLRPRGLRLRLLPCGLRLRPRLAERPPPSPCDGSAAPVSGKPPPSLMQARCVLSICLTHGCHSSADARKYNGQVKWLRDRQRAHRYTSCRG